MNFFAKNIKFLRIQKDMTQTEVATSIGFKQTAWSGYEKGTSTPNFNDLLKIIKYFGITASSLLEIDLQNVEVNQKSTLKSKNKNVEVNHEVSVEVIPSKDAYVHDFKVTVVAEDVAKYGQRAAIIPITDIAVAAGGGIYNNDHIEVEDALHLPARLLKPGHTYLCVKIKGLSMAPTLQDGGYVVIRFLDKSEWANMPDQRIFVVIDTEGKSYVKRVKNRFKRGFIVMRSDSMDQHNYPTLNLDTNEIAAIWYVEWYFSAKMPNINDQYYNRLQLLEEKVDDLVSNTKIVKPK